MSDFARDAESRSTNPKMHALAGFADADRCNLLNHNKRKAEALEACNRALASGETFYALLERGYVRERSDPTAALADISRALALRPQDTAALAVRAWLLAQRRDYAGHARDLVLLRELDPVQKVSKEALAWAAQGLAADAARNRGAGRTDDQILALKRAIVLDPDNLDNHLRLDDALVHAGQLQRVPPMWRGYLKRHPGDARAHRELAGALHHLGQDPRALSEAGAACRLGDATGCAIVVRFGGHH